MLTGVSCPAPDVCIAVGNDETVSFTFRTLAERWDGRTWTLQAMPKPARSGVAGLGGVSCPRVADCFAVGGAGNGTLVEHWDGRSWQIQDSGTGRHGSLGAVSCSGPDACTAVGFTGTHRLLAERWDGKRWTIQHPPSHWKSPLLFSVSCPTATDCTAVGLSGDTGPTFAERWAAAGGGLQSTRNPTQISVLDSVSCSSPSACIATGDSERPVIPATEKVLIERWNGRVWKLQPTPATDPSLRPALGSVVSVSIRLHGSWQRRTSEGPAKRAGRALERPPLEPPVHSGRERARRPATHWRNVRGAGKLHGRWLLPRHSGQQPGEDAGGAARELARG